MQRHSDVEKGIFLKTFTLMGSIIPTLNHVKVNTHILSEFLWFLMAVYLSLSALNRRGSVEFIPRVEHLHTAIQINRRGQHESID